MQRLVVEVGVRVGAGHGDLVGVGSVVVGGGRVVERRRRVAGSGVVGVGRKDRGRVSGWNSVGYSGWDEASIS